MGNLCGKESKESKDNFTGPGRTVGSVPARNPNAKVSVPAHVTGGSSKPVPKVGGLGRTLGAGGAGSGSQGDDARSAAAAAAEIRANQPPKGVLAKNLEAQKRQTHTQTLQAAAAENRMQRETDQATETRTYN